MSDTKLREKADALIAFTLQGPRFIAWVEAVTDAIAPEPEKVAKVETDHSGYHFASCKQSAPPEPAAREMPEAVKEAIDFLRELGNEGNPNKQCTENICRQRADALESWWRNLVQPVAVGMTEELADLLDSIMAFADADPDTPVKQIWRKKVSAVREQAVQPVAVGMTEALRMILDVAESRAEDQRHDGLLECSRNLERAIAAVRQQAAHRQRPKLEKVRGALSWLKMQYEPGSQGYTPNATVWKMTEAALAELDDAEGKRRE